MPAHLKHIILTFYVSLNTMLGKLVGQRVNIKVSQDMVSIDTEFCPFGRKAGTDT